MSLDVQDWSHSQSESRPWHQVRDDTLMCLTPVYLSELFLVVHLDSNSVLQDILDVLLLGDFLSVLVFKSEHLLEVCRMAPCHLDSR